jgi:uncharacterized protein YutD
MMKQPKPIIIQFIDEAFQEFNVMENEYPKVIKYTGRIESIQPHIKDYCTCMFFTIKNTKEFTDEYKRSFQCKHINEARKIRWSRHN